MPTPPATPAATAPDRAVGLDTLLLDHPLADDAGLIHTVDRSVTAGDAKASARRLAQTLRPWFGVATSRPST